VLIIATIYAALVYLLFFKLRWLPWNKLTRSLSAIVGVIILAAFLVGLQCLTPASAQAIVTGQIIEIAPEISGRVQEVPVEPYKAVESNDVLFTIEDTHYRARVEELTAKLELARLRQGQYEQLASKSAGSRFQLEQAEAETKQLESQLIRAELDLTNTVVRAPSKGAVPRLFLRPGMQVSPSRAVLTFADTSKPLIGALFQQKALEKVRVGDKALVNFPMLPGQVFETEVIAIPTAIGDAQVLASGQLPSVKDQRMTRLYPIYLAMPKDYPTELNRFGLAATVYIHTEGAGVVGIVAVSLQWIATSLDAIL